MKTLNRLIIILSLLLLTSCGVHWQISTFNYDPIYEDENYVLVSDDIKIDTLNEFQFRNRLRTDFQFRYDFAQYALSQPRSFDWNNRLLGTRYNWNNSYWGYNYYWNRDQIWNDWAWGFTPHRWSLFGYDRWGYNNWMGNVYYGYGYGWNLNYVPYNWRRSNINGRRGSVSPRVRSTIRTRTTPNNVRPTRTTIPNNTRTIRTPRRNSNMNSPIRTNTRSNTTQPTIRNNNTRPSYNTRPSNNTRPRINNTNTTRSRSTNVNRSTTSRGGNSARRQ